MEYNTPEFEKVKDMIAGLAGDTNLPDVPSNLNLDKMPSDPYRGDGNQIPQNIPAKDGEYTVTPKLKKSKSDF